MTEREFRRIALSLPEAVEASHMNHPDFRVGGKIFATLGYPDTSSGMVKLTPKQQAMFVKSAPDVFEPSPGAWGRNGATKVHLRPAKKDRVREALVTAWENTAPKRLARQGRG
jgi:hypothetical protein